MNRRKFLTRAIQASAAAGCSTLMPGFATLAKGATPDQFFVFISAQGGWDQTHLCDPKGNQISYDGERGPINKYHPSEIRKAGNIAYAPMPAGARQADKDNDQVDTFFQTHYQRLTVLNGVKIGSNSHETGTRIAARGTGSTAIPNFGAMHANTFGADLPMPFMGEFAFGNNSKDLTTHTSLGVFDRLSSLSNGNGVYGSSDAMPTSVYNRVQQFANAELNRRHNAEGVTSRKQAMQQLQDSRASIPELSNTLSYLPEQPSTGHKGTAERIAASFASGNSIFAAAGFGGFDNHGNVDAEFGASINQHLEGVNHLWSELERHGIADKTTIVMTSDLGRTPWYNERQGKDHWGITSYMIMSNQFGGNRVIGATNDQLHAEKINPTTLAVDNENGVYLTPGIMHQELRRRSGVAGTFIDYTYKLDALDLDFLA